MPGSPSATPCRAELLAPRCAGRRRVPGLVAERPGRDVAAGRAISHPDRVQGRSQAWRRDLPEVLAIHHSGGHTAAVRLPARARPAHGVQSRFGRVRPGASEGPTSEVPPIQAANPLIGLKDARRQARSIVPQALPAGAPQPRSGPEESSAAGRLPVVGAPPAAAASAPRVRERAIAVRAGKSFRPRGRGQNPIRAGATRQRGPRLLPSLSRGHERATPRQNREQTREQIREAARKLPRAQAG